MTRLRLPFAVATASSLARLGPRTGGLTTLALLGTALLCAATGCSRSELGGDDAAPSPLLAAPEPDVVDVAEDIQPPDASDDTDRDTEDVPREDVLPDAPPGCGDGVVDDGEECDDGARNGDAPGACRSDCTRPFCGDGIVDPEELCDDGDANSDEEPDACRTSCQPATCGDGVVDDGEECDDPEKPGYEGCGIDCRLPATPCTPCANDRDCGRDVDLCSPLLDGRFCTTGCDTDDDCAEGFTCQPVRGRSFGQCIPPEDVCTPCLDNDGDGYGFGLECLGLDCNDANPAINPGAEEICDDLDNDCDGENDEGCPPDLIVDSETVELAGAWTFDRVEVRNGGVLRVIPFEGELGQPDTDPNGCLIIDARIVVVDPTGTIDAQQAGGAGRGTGRDGGFGRNLINTGPAGGSYGGIGGTGPELFPSPVYGTSEEEDIDQGSNGGRFRITARGLGEACDALEGSISAGGQGGGCISLRAPDIDVSGTLVANGGPGQSASRSLDTTIVDGGAGGSGGGILLRGARVHLRSTARLAADGGNGGRGGRFVLREGSEECIGNGGGGGGGGRIKIFGARTLDGQLSTRGGTGAEGPQSSANSGRPGTIVTR